MSLSSAVGRFVGAVLVEIAPILSEIFKDVYERTISNTVEESHPRDDLRTRLLAIVKRERMRDKDNHCPTGTTDTDKGDDQGRENMGDGQ
jgi:hypothetical protein